MLALVLPMLLSAQRSPFNGLDVLPADSTGHYRILIGGHFHGESSNRSGFPARTLLANIDTVNSLGAHLFLSTGDLFMDPVNDLPRYQRSLFSKLKMPFFNAPGNHDNGNATDQVVRIQGHKQAIYAPTDPGASVAWREMPGPVVALLNTERGDGSADAERMAVLGRVFEMVDPAHKATRSRSTVFIVSHRPIWAEDDPQYGPLFPGNTRSVLGTDFRKDVYPLLERIAKHAHVYWISGSMGGTAQSSIFFQQHAPNITFIQCAIRDVPRDALLIADVYPDTVKWSALSLTGQELLAPEAYDAAWWRKHLGTSEGFNWKLVPYRVKTTVLRKEFWWGAGFMLVLVWAIRRVLRR